LSERYEPLYTFREPAPAGPFRPQFRAPGSGVSAAASPAAREEIRQVINRVSPQHGLDPCLVQAVVEIESNYAACAVSPKGAQGLMQIMPATQRDLGLTSPFDPHQNIDAGIRYLKYLMQKFGSVHLALAAYNAGPAEVERHSGIPPFPETQDYVTRVMSKYLWYKYIR
jgi:soluble lytic murein transglycosylase-like protein